MMNTTFVLSLHALPALLALILGIFILAMKKGTGTHRAMGYLWVSLMIVLSITGAFIREVNQGSFSLVHLLVPYTLVSVIYAIFAIRKYKDSDDKVRDRAWREKHKRTMTSLFIFALLLAGSLTLLPGRMLHELFFE